MKINFLLLNFFSHTFSEVLYLMKISLPYFLLVFIVALWCVLLFIPPLIAHVESPSSDISQHLYKSFSPICHQYESRSLHLFDHKLAVCARCTGIYIGFFIGILLLLLIRIGLNYSTITLWIVALVPMLFDVILDGLQIHRATLLTRFVTGSFFGTVAAFILAPLIIKTIKEIFFRNKIMQGVHYESKT